MSDNTVDDIIPYMVSYDGAVELSDFRRTRRVGRVAGSAKRNEIAAMLDALTRLGPGLGRPIVDTLNGSEYPNMKELRGRTPGAILRVAFAFDPERVAQILCGGDKKGVSQKKFYKKLIEKADKLYRLHLQAMAGKKKGR